MELARDERIFVIILIANTVLSFIYLLAGALVIVPAHSAAREEGEEALYDNRRAYLLRTIVMLLCPIIGPLFFFMSHLFYVVVFWKGVDLADVIFGKERVRTRRKAEEERERNIVPLEEAVLVNEKADLRQVMMNVLKDDIQSCLAAIALALDSEDSEASHYAAAVLSDELNRFRLYVQDLWKQAQEDEPPEETQCEEMLLDYMDGVLRQRIFSKPEQHKFVGILEGAAESLYMKDAQLFKLEWYESVCLRTLEEKDFGACAKWCRRLAERFPDELCAYTCWLKLYFARQDREAFFEALDALKGSNVVIDNETLELIRIFSQAVT